MYIKIGICFLILNQTCLHEYKMYSEIPEIWHFEISVPFSFLELFKKIFKYQDKKEIFA